MSTLEAVFHFFSELVIDKFSQKPCWMWVWSEWGGAEECRPEPGEITLGNKSPSEQLLDSPLLLEERGNHSGEAV
jgi:hypothetical protein